MGTEAKRYFNFENAKEVDALYDLLLSKDYFVGVRDGYINLYHNCASVGKISVDCKSAEVHRKYLSGSTDTTIVKAVNGRDDGYCSIPIDIFCLKGTQNLILENIKHNYSSTTHREKAYQQEWIEHVNRNPKSQWNFIDLEYCQSGFTKRIDIVAVSKMSTGGKHKIALIELKADDSAFGGGKDGSGVTGHMKTLHRYLTDKSVSDQLRADVCGIIRSKRSIRLREVEWTDGLDITADLFDPTVEVYFVTFCRPDNIKACARTFSRYLYDDVPRHSSCTAEKILGREAISNAVYHYWFAETTFAETPKEEHVSASLNDLQLKTAKDAGFISLSELLGEWSPI